MKQRHNIDKNSAVINIEDVVIDEGVIDIDVAFVGELYPLGKPVVPLV